MLQQLMFHIVFFVMIISILLMTIQQLKAMVFSQSSTSAGKRTRVIGPFT